MLRAGPPDRDAGVRAVRWALLVFLCAQGALAQRRMSPEEEQQRRLNDLPNAWPRGSLMITPKVGFALPVSSLPGAVSLALEAGYRTPWLGRRLFATGQISWSRPEFSGGGYSATVHHFGASLAAVYRLDRIDSVVAPFVGAGAALFATDADVEVNGVARPQKDLRPGVIGFVGLDLLDVLTGAGAISFELRLLRAPTTVPSLRDSSVEPFVASMGYRIFFL
jgi:hypothetical protein